MPPVPTVAPNSSEIQELREDLGLSRPDLARKIGCHPQTVWDVENKGIRLSKPMIARFARALRVKVARITAADQSQQAKPRQPNGAAA